MQTSTRRTIETLVAFLAGAAVFAWCSGEGTEEHHISTGDVMEYGLDSSRASVVAREMNHRLDTLLSFPAVQSIIDTAKTSEAAFQAARQASWQGIRTLPPATLDTALANQLKLIRVATEEECNQLAQGTLSMTGLLRLYGRLDTATIKRIMSINTRGSIAAISGATERVQVSKEVEKEAWHALADAAPRDSLDRFLELIDKEQQLTDRERCWLVGFITKAVQEMEDEHRRVLLKLTTQAE